MLSLLWADRGRSADSAAPWWLVKRALPGGHTVDVVNVEDTAMTVYSSFPAWCVNVKKKEKKLL